MEAEQVLVLLHAASHLHDGDGEAVRGGGEHGRRQRHVALVQELYRGRSQRSLVSEQWWAGLAGVSGGGRACLTLQDELLHLDLVELVGADDDAVAGQMDAAARLQGLDLLQRQVRRSVSQSTGARATAPPSRLEVKVSLPCGCSTC